MTLESVMQLARMTVWTTLALAGPILVAGLAAGLLVSVFQAVTQIHEMTLTFIPKIVAVAVVSVIFYNFMMTAILDFTVRMFTTFPDISGKPGMWWTSVTLDPDAVVTFLLMFFRILSLIMVLPVFGSLQVIEPVKAGLGFYLTVAAFLTLRPTTHPMPHETAPILLAAAGEIFIGLAMGFAVRAAMEAINFAGDILSFQAGLTVSNVVDPHSGERVSLLSNFLTMTAGVVFLASGLYREFIAGIIHSFIAAPPGAIALRAAGIGQFTAIGAGIYSDAVRIGAPWIVVLLLVKVGLGLMARTFPQMNVFFVGFPVTIALGLLVLAWSLPRIVTMTAELFEGSLTNFWIILRAAT